MKLFWLLFLTSFIFTACSSSKSGDKKSNSDRSYTKSDTIHSMADKYQNLITVTLPQADQKAISSKVYIDSMDVIDYKNQKALLITGSFANGCSALESVNHHLAGDTLRITLTGWQPAEMMCTQALVPFSFIYSDISENELTRFKVIKTANPTINL